MQLSEARKLIPVFSGATSIVKKFKFIWKSVRKRTDWISNTYYRCVDIADKLNIDIPEPKINMEIEKNG